MTVKKNIYVFSILFCIYRSFKILHMEHGAAPCNVRVQALVKLDERQPDEKQINFIVVIIHGWRKVRIVMCKQCVA